MRTLKSLAVTLVIVSALFAFPSSLLARTEPKDYLAENLPRAHDVLKAWFQGCMLHLQISYSREVSSSMRVEIPLEHMDRDAVRLDESDEPKGLTLEAKNQRRVIKATFRDGSYIPYPELRIFVGDSKLADELAANFRKVILYCNLSNSEN